MEHQTRYGYDLGLSSNFVYIFNYYEKMPLK